MYLLRVNLFKRRPKSLAILTPSHSQQIHFYKCTTPGMRNVLEFWTGDERNDTNKLVCIVAVRNVRKRWWGQL